ncbi:adenosine 5-phosphosulfate kinase [Plesiocystis pacifica SIR-1]|uniref:Adenylyl-sulfate kinase n=1 Tax=Plesiocystis pacifica SIR-1 TaxID=391625 RepID=A6G4B2_9BACT|nr:adenylyl-sulfate kinase [Plesiocystis pacifica]EDM79224.1 adenosine 5-phosphosulfate kinase [Plesiocystis pacifica SIR-1]
MTEPQPIVRADREALNPHRGALVWFTGLSGSGKTTLARAVERELNRLGVRTYRLDGDVMRDGLNADLGFSPEDRRENVRRNGEVGRLMVDAGLVVLVAVIAPYAADRQAARARFGEGDFFQVWVDTSLEVCEQRDVKGLYARARSGELKNFTGISAPYEVPQNPEHQAAGAGALTEERDRVIAMLRDAGVMR